MIFIYVRPFYSLIYFYFKESIVCTAIKVCKINCNLNLILNFYIFISILYLAP